VQTLQQLAMLSYNKKNITRYLFLATFNSTINMFAKDFAIMPNMLPTKLMKMKSVLPNLDSNSGISQNVLWSTLSFLRWQTSATTKKIIEISPVTIVKKKMHSVHFTHLLIDLFSGGFCSWDKILWPQLSKKS
jgi:hypothetical protein